MRVAYLANVSIVPDQTSEAGNVKYCSDYMPEVVSDSSQDFKKMLESRSQELTDGLPIPVNIGR